VKLSSINSPCQLLKKSRVTHFGKETTSTDIQQNYTTYSPGVDFEKQTLVNMCRGTRIIYRCCGHRRIIYDEDEDQCPQEEIDSPSHRVMGRIVGHRLCNDCRRNRQEETERRHREYAEATGRAKAVLEYFRGERESPVTDAEPSSTRGPRAVRNRAFDLASLESARQLIWEYARVEMDQRRLARAETQSAIDTGEIVNRETPIDFREWSRENRRNIPSATIDREIEGYLEYLRGFHDINYPTLFLAGARRILRDQDTSLEFVPDDGSGRLMSFNTFVRTAVPRVPETFGYCGEGSERYARYLFTESSFQVYWDFRRFRERISQNIREYLDSLTPTGVDAGWHPQRRLQTFREWTSSNIRVFDPEPSDVDQLQLDIDEYEHSYLGQNSDARMLLDFRDLRRRIRANDVENFDFHPHTEGVEGFQEWLSDALNPDLIWDQALESYPLYLQRLGQPGLAQRFERVRGQRALEDRRQFEGRPRADPHTRPDMFPDPTARSESQLSSELRRVSSELAAELVRQSGEYPREMIAVALLTIATQLHRHRTAVSANRHLTLGEWDDCAQELGRLVLVFSPRPSEANPQARQPAAGEAARQDPGPSTHRNSVGSLTFDDEAIVFLPSIQPAVTEQMQDLFESGYREFGSHPEATAPLRPPSSLSSLEEYVVIDPEWVSIGQHEIPSPEARDHPDSIVVQLERANQARRDRTDERRRRQREYLRPLTPEAEDGESDVDVDEVRERILDAVLDRMGDEQE
jgi:hypothetical protein